MKIILIVMFFLSLTIRVFAADDIPIKTLNVQELQKKYLRAETESQKEIVLKGMIAGADDSTAPVIEKTFLEGVLIENALIELDEMYNQDLLIQYCEIRKNKAKPFIEKLRIKCYQRLEHFRVWNRGVLITKEKMKVELDRFFDQLEQSKPEASMEDVIKEISAKTDSEDFIFIILKFARSAKEQPIEKICQICLDAAVSAKDPEQKLLLLNLLRIQYEGKNKIKLDFTKFKTQFEKLLADQSMFPEEFGVRQMVPLVVARMIDAKAEDDFTGNLTRRAMLGKGARDLSMRSLYRGFYGQWDKKYVQYMICRAKTILDGTTADKLPIMIEAEEFNDAQINGAKAKITGKEDNEIKEFCRNARLEELVPLSLALERDKQLNSKLLPLANLITETDTDIPEIKTQIEKFKGKTLNEQILQDILKLAENCMQNGQPVKASMLRSSALQGVIMKFNRPRMSTMNLNTNTNMNIGSNSVQELKAHFSFDGPQGEGMSRVVAVKNKPLEKNMDQALSGNKHPDHEFLLKKEKKFMEDFSEAFLKSGNALFSGKIIIYDRM